MHELLSPLVENARELYNLDAGELYAMLRERTARHTMGDSSSVRRETAEELLRSILYCIALHLRLHPEADATMPVQSLYEAGIVDVERMLRRGRALLHQAEARRVPIENIAYADTLAELGQFFRRYDYHTFAHAIPCSIDYPLCHPVPDQLTGVAYVDEYLRRLCMENDFLAHFAPASMIALLQSQCADYKELLINLYTPVAEAAIGLALLGSPVSPLSSGDATHADLQAKLVGEDLSASLYAAADVVCAELGMTGMAASYFRDAAADMLPRLTMAVNG